METTDKKRERLARMEAAFEAQGGRNIGLAESIDALREDIENDRFRDHAERELYFEDARVCIEDDAPVRIDEQAGGRFVQAWIFVGDDEPKD